MLYIRAEIYECGRKCVYARQYTRHAFKYSSDVAQYTSDVYIETFFFMTNNTALTTKIATISQF